MKKFLWLFVSVLTLGLTLPNQVNAEVVVENFKETVEDEIKTMEALEKQYPDEYKKAGYGEYVDVIRYLSLKASRFSIPEVLLFAPLLSLFSLAMFNNHPYYLYMNLVPAFYLLYKIPYHLTQIHCYLT